VKGPLDRREKMCKTMLQEECGGRCWKGPVYRKVESRGRKSPFLREGLHLFLQGLNERLL
jgi:hypothetical protein